MKNKILFVDDEEFLLQSMQRQLHGKFNIDICADPVKAIEMIKRQEYAVIVSDYMMPFMDGVEFLKKAKEITPDSIRILFTGNADLDVAVLAVNEGNVFKFLVKPIVSDKLAQVLRLALGEYKNVYHQKLQAEQNEFLALHDALTGLPNRIYLLQKLKDAISLSKRNNNFVAVLFMDLDGFKNVNDTYGHKTGDKLLKNVAHILSGSVRESDTVARFGGDEFVVVLQGINKLEEAKISAQRIIDALVQPILIDQYKCNIGTSVGICIYPTFGTNAEQLIKNADIAMYIAKKQGGSKYVYFDNEH